MMRLGWRPQRRRSAQLTARAMAYSLYFLSKQTLHHLRCGPAWRTLKLLNQKCHFQSCVILLTKQFFSGHLKAPEHSVVMAMKSNF